MKLNNKGFTLVEILATVAIMAILSGVAVAGVTRYLEKTRQKAYEAIENNVYDAASAYIQKYNPVIPIITEEVESSPLLDDDEKDEIRSNWNRYTSASTIYKLSEDGACNHCFYTLDIDTLQDKELIKKVIDPKTKEATCTGKVLITKEKSDSTKLESYTYLVMIECSDYKSSHPVMKQEDKKDRDGNVITDSNGYPITIDVKTNETANGVFYHS